MTGNTVTLNLKIAGADQVKSALKSVGAVLKTALAVTVGSELAQSLGRIADAANNNAAKLRIVTKTAQEFARAQSDVLSISQLTGSAIAATTDLYSKLAQSLGRLNATQTQLATVTQAVSQALLVSGATTQGAIGALTQLGQAFSSGVLRGQEFNSVAEQAPRLLQAIADEMDVPVQALRGLAKQGKITSDVLLRALTGEGAAKIAAEAANIPLTIGRAYTQLENVFERYVGEADKATGASKALVSIISAVANNLGTIAPLLVGTGFLAFAVAVGRSTSALVVYIAGMGAARASATAELAQNVALLASRNAIAQSVIRLTTLRAAAAVGEAAQLRTTIALERAQILGATAAQRLATAQAAASVSSAGFGSSLLALVGGPIGAVVVGLGLIYAALQLFKSASEEASEASIKAIQEESDGLDRQIELIKAKTRAVQESQRGAPTKPEDVESAKAALAAEQQAEALANARAETERLGEATLLTGNLLSVQGAQFLYSAFQAGKLSETINGLSAKKAELAAETVALEAAEYATGEAFNFTTKAADALKKGLDSLADSTGDLDKKSGNLYAQAQEKIKGFNDELLKIQGGDPFEARLKQYITLLEYLGLSTKKDTEILKDYVTARDRTSAAEDAAAAAKKALSDANADLESAETKAATAMERLNDIARDLSAQFKGPGAQANEKYEDTINRIEDALTDVVKNEKNATVIAKAFAVANQAAADALRQKKTALDDVATAQKAADDAVTNYTSSAEIELRNLGLSREERRINEAGLRAEAELRAKITEATKNNTGAYADLSEAQIDSIVNAEVAAARVAESQNITAEAGRKASEEYQRQWEQAFDDIVDAALRGGDALKGVVQQYLFDIRKDFAKKIFLDVVTRYKTEGSPGNKGGKDGKDNGASVGGTGFDFGGLAAGISGLRDAYRTGGGLGGAASGALAGAQIGSVVPIIGTVIGAIVGAIAGFFGGAKPPDLRLGAAGVTRKPEQTFNTAFGAQQIGVRGGTDTKQFIDLLTEFDKSIAGIVGSFSNGTAQVEAVQARLRTWSVDLKGDAITAEAVLGSRFNAILSTFNADIQAFVGTLGTTAERAQRLQDAAFIEGATKASILASTFNDLARILTANKIEGESVAQTYERVSASVEILRAALQISGVTVTQTGDEFIKFAADIATAAGGTQQAAQLWETYFDTFYTAEESALKATEQANARRTSALAAIGLDANTTAEQFRETFERLLPTLTPEQVVLYLRAGAAIGAAADAQDAYNVVLTEGADAAEAAGEKLRGLADSLRTIEQQIDAGFTELERSGFTDFERSLLSINDNLQATTASLLEQRQAAVDAGASAQTLARYDLALGRAQLLAAAQAAAAIEKLRKAARSLIDQLYGKGAAQQFAGAGTQAFQDIGDAAQSMYESQLNSIKTIQDYLDGQLLGGTSTLTPVEQFDEAQRQFNAAVLAGNAQEAVRLADVLLKLGQARFASSQPYTDLESAVRAALQGLIGTIGQPVPPGAVGPNGSAGSPEEFDAAARENRLELALQLSEIVRELLIATGGSLEEVAASIGLNMTALVTDLGVNLTDLSVGTASSLATIAQSLGVELADLARNVGVDLGELSDSQSLINGALKGAIDKLPEGQRDKLKELLKDVEDAAKTGGPLEINRAIGALETQVNLIGGATASALAPFFTGVNPVDPLNSIDSAVRELWKPGSLLDQINAGIAELVRRTTLPQGQTAPPIGVPPAGNNAVFVPNAVIPGRSSFTATPANTEGNTAVIEQLKRTVARLESLEATVRSGTTQQVRATVGVGETIVSASDKRQPVKPKLVMSE